MFLIPLSSAKWVCGWYFGAGGRWCSQRGSEDLNDLFGSLYVLNGGETRHKSTSLVSREMRAWESGERELFALLHFILKQSMGRFQLPTAAHPLSRQKPLSAS